ncbi:MAG: glycosyl transferase [Clostridia bacterium]|nr:glycosyl transferase [Clostridia bacterium]
MSSVLKLVKNPAKIVYIFDKVGISRLIPDRAYLKMKYRASFGRKLNLKDPKTYNEKLQWLKLYDRCPEYTDIVDKYEVKRIVADIIGEEYIIPTLGAWEKAEDIDFDALPEKFVLKCTHDSGGLVICRDKAELDIEAARKKLKRALKRNFYHLGREWPYKNVKPRIIAEEYMEDEATGELRDYKFFCFDGTPRALFIATERQKAGEEVKFDFFDMDYTHLPFRHGHPNADTIPEKPKNFELMKSLAEKLSAGFPQVRADFYEVNGRVYFGELTFFHHNGFMPFDPEEWDYTFGEWITLPKKTER